MSQKMSQETEGRGEEKWDLKNIWRKKVRLRKFLKNVFCFSNVLISSIVFLFSFVLLLSGPNLNRDRLRHFLKKKCFDFFSQLFFFKYPYRTWTFDIEFFLIFLTFFSNVPTFKCPNGTWPQLCLTCRMYLLF